MGFPLQNGICGKNRLKLHDESILIQIADENLVALKVKYHKHCYGKYTSFLRHSHSTQSNENEGEKHECKYEESFNVFCEEFVKEKLIKQENIFLKIVRHNVQNHSKS
jgi:hypothetical protein